MMRNVPKVWFSIVIFTAASAVLGYNGRNYLPSSKSIGNYIGRAPSQSRMEYSTDITLETTRTTTPYDTTENTAYFTSTTTSTDVTSEKSDATFTSYPGTMEKYESEEQSSRSSSKGTSQVNSYVMNLISSKYSFTKLNPSGSAKVISRSRSSSDRDANMYRIDQEASLKHTKPQTDTSEKKTSETSNERFSKSIVDAWTPFSSPITVEDRTTTVLTMNTKYTTKQTTTIGQKTTTTVPLEETDFDDYYDAYTLTSDDAESSLLYKSTTPEDMEISEGTLDSDIFELPTTTTFITTTIPDYTTSEVALTSTEDVYDLDSSRSSTTLKDDSTTTVLTINTKYTTQPTTTVGLQTTTVPMDFSSYEVSDLQSSSEPSSNSGIAIETISLKEITTEPILELRQEHPELDTTERDKSDISSTTDSTTSADYRTVGGSSSDQDQTTGRTSLNQDSISTPNYRLEEMGSKTQSLLINLLLKNVIFGKNRKPAPRKPRFFDSSFNVKTRLNRGRVRVLNKLLTNKGRT